MFIINAFDQNKGHKFDSLLERNILVSLKRKFQMYRRIFLSDQFMTDVDDTGLTLAIV